MTELSTLNQAGLPAATKDELKKIVIYHVTAENAAVCVTKVGHVNTLSIEKIKEKKQMKKPKKVSADISRKHISGVQQCDTDCIP